MSSLPCLLTLKHPERHLLCFRDSVSVITPFMAGWAAVHACIDSFTVAFPGTGVRHSVLLESRSYTDASGELPVGPPAPAERETHRAAACCQLKWRAFTFAWIPKCDRVCRAPPLSVVHVVLFSPGSTTHMGGWVCRSSCNSSAAGFIGCQLSECLSVSREFLPSDSWWEVRAHFPISDSRLPYPCFLSLIPVSVQNMPSALPVRGVFSHACCVDWRTGSSAQR